MEQVKLISDETLAHSTSWPLIKPLGPWVIDGFGKLIPAFKNMFNELSSFFAGLATPATT
jgi:membrane protein required for colicin V production